jgi:5'(3')-deoxyribonucleotidase
MQTITLQQQLDLLDQWNGYLNLAQDLLVKIRQAEAYELAGIIDHRHRLYKKIDHIKHIFLHQSKQLTLKDFEQAILDEKINLLQQRSSEIAISANKALKVLMDKLSKTKIEMASLHKSNKAIKAYTTTSTASYALA